MKLLGEQQDVNQTIALMKKEELPWHIKKIAGQRQEETKQVVSLGLGGLEGFFLFCVGLLLMAMCWLVGWFLCGTSVVSACFQWKR